MLVGLLAVVGCGGDDDSERAIVGEVTVADLNVLHGLFCPSETGDCRVADRIDLLFEWVASVGCPDVVTLQEVLGRRAVDLVRRAAASSCPFAYEVLEPPMLGQNFTLSRYPVVESHEDALVGFLRTRLLWHTRIDHPNGMVDVFNTHLAAGVDLGGEPCQEPCPAECVDAGAVSNRDCQAVQIANLVEQHAAPGSLRVLAGDFNSTSETFVYDYLVNVRGWTDSYLEAGNPECDPATGVGCTSGREDEDLGDLESPAGGERSRIDFLFVREPASASSCSYEIDSADDADGDGFATMIFAGEPNPFSADCGALPSSICWPSDHEGMQADLNCR